MALYVHDDNADNKVTMVAVSKQQQNEPRSNKSTNYNNQRYNRPQRQERRERQETNGPPVTECSICGLIRDKDVPQECLNMDFKDRHREITSRPIFPNDCLAWIRLSLDDREKVLRNNELHSKMCLRPLRQGARGSTCNRGRHTINNGCNGMCIEKGCEMHSTVCRAHADDNRNAHRIYKACIDWANIIRPQTTGQSTGSMSFLMTVDEEVESSSEKELVEMNSMRKEIHI